MNQLYYGDNLQVLREHIAAESVDEWKWNWLYTPYNESYAEDFYKFVEEGSGRRYRLSDKTAPGGASPEKRNPHYEFLGVTRYWRYSQETMAKLHAEGRIVQTGREECPLTNDTSTKCPVSGYRMTGATLCPQAAKKL